jgi:chemotaxis family two-component system response regulator Rcp1
MNNELTTILLIEDNPTDVYLFKNALERANVKCELIVLSDGGMAMEFVRRQGKYAASNIPELAIVDCGLPIYDGIDVLNALRQSIHFANLPVVIVSSSINPTELVKMGRLDVIRYFDKPSDLEGFFQIGLAVKQILLEHRALATAAGAY